MAVEQGKQRAPVRAQRARMAVAGGVGVLVTLFAVFNLDDVEVNWLLGTWSTPLIVVIAISFLAGVAVDRALVRRARSPKARAKRAT
jgi:uncharacterized integral membrane protein